MMSIKHMCASDLITYLSKVEMKCIDKIKENTHTHTRRKNYYRIKMKK